MEGQEVLGEQRAGMSYCLGVPSAWQALVGGAVLCTRVKQDRRVPAGAGGSKL